MSILVVDFGSQLTQLIARRLRDLGFYTEIQPHQKINSEFLANFRPGAIILSGGPASVLDEGSPRAHSAIFEFGCPILGICYGQQLLAHQLGGAVQNAGVREFGFARLNIVHDSPLFAGIWQKGQSYQVWMSHGDKVVQIPDGYQILAQSESAEYAVFAHPERQIYGVMFHPEASHTLDGAAVLANFAENIAHLKRDWNMDQFSTRTINDIKQRVGKNRVISGLSGGVDSAVASVLVHRAIGDQLSCIFIDNGLLRAGEADQVRRLFSQHYAINLVFRDASAIFLNALDQVTDPEQKRKIIGKIFIDIFKEEAQKLGGSDFLVQGTLYPDVIESVSLAGNLVTIKSHHNVGGLPKELGLQLIEPLRELFKDEVRALGRSLGIPAAMINRHPFPGPGLAIRIIGAVTAEKCAILRQVDSIFLDEIHKNGFYDKIWQAFAALLPVQTVGVMGDDRTYDYMVCLRAVTSVDGMTAEAFSFPPEFLNQTATKIINHVKGVNRVVYDYSSKPPATIEYE